jgi:hypothetical protein
MSAAFILHSEETQNTVFSNYENIGTHLEGVAVPDNDLNLRPRKSPFRCASKEYWSETGRVKDTIPNHSLT